MIIEQVVLIFAALVVIIATLFNLFDTPLILALSAICSKMSSVTSIFYHRVLVSCHYTTFDKVKGISVRDVQSHVNYLKSKVALKPFERIFFKLYQKMQHDMITKTQ